MWARGVTCLHLWLNYWPSNNESCFFVRISPDILCMYVCICAYMYIHICVSVVCMPVCMCVHVCGKMNMPAHVKARDWCLMLPLIMLYFIYWIKVFHWTWSLHNQFVYLASLWQASLCLTSMCWDYSQITKHTQNFYGH